MADGVDQDLDGLRHAYNGMEHMLNDVSRDLASKIPERMHLEFNVTFFPQIGFLISVPIKTDTGRVMSEAEMDQVGGWSLIFTSTEQQYFKDAHMRELDSVWGDIYTSICGQSRV